LQAAVTSNDVASDFGTYHDSILAQVESMDGSRASAVGTADDNIRASARATLETSLDAAATTGAVVQAYVTFDAAVSTAMQGIGGMSSSQLDASTQTLMLIDSNV